MLVASRELAHLVGLRVLRESWILLSHFPSLRGLVWPVSVIWRTRTPAKGVRIGVLSADWPSGNYRAVDAAGTG